MLLILGLLFLLSLCQQVYTWDTCTKPEDCDNPALDCQPFFCYHYPCSAQKDCDPYPGLACIQGHCLPRVQSSSIAATSFSSMPSTYKAPPTSTKSVQAKTTSVPGGNGTSSNSSNNNQEEEVMGKISPVATGVIATGCSALFLVAGFVAYFCTRKQPSLPSDDLFSPNNISGPSQGPLNGFGGNGTPNGSFGRGMMQPPQRTNSLARFQQNSGFRQQQQQYQQQMDPPEYYDDVPEEGYVKTMREAELEKVLSSKGVDRNANAGVDPIAAAGKFSLDNVYLEEDLGNSGSMGMQSGGEHGQGGGFGMKEAVMVGGMVTGLSSIASSAIKSKSRDRDSQLNRSATTSPLSRQQFYAENDGDNVMRRSVTSAKHGKAVRFDSFDFPIVDQHQEDYDSGDYEEEYEVVQQDYRNPYLYTNSDNLQRSYTSVSPGKQYKSQQQNMPQVQRSMTTFGNGAKDPSLHRKLFSNLSTIKEQPSYQVEDESVIDSYSSPSNVKRSATTKDLNYSLAKDTGDLGLQRSITTAAPQKMKTVKPKYGRNLQFQFEV